MTVISAIQEALVLLGNASCHMSTERRSRALTKLNPDLKFMAEEEDFSKAQPFLFGKGFEQRAKDRTEALKCLRRAATKQPPKKFFQGDRPHQSGSSGGGNLYCQFKPRNNSFRKPHYQQTETKTKKAQ